MSRVRDRLAASAAWRQYGAELTEMDRMPGRLEAAGADPASAKYSEVRHDRTGFAASCYPGAPEPGRTNSGCHLLAGPGPQEGKCAEPEAGA